MEEADEIMRNLVYNIINYEKILIKIPYAGYELPHQSSIRIITDVLDNSNAFPQISRGQFSRLSLGIVIDDAYLWDTRIRNNIEILVN